MDEWVTHGFHWSVDGFLVADSMLGLQQLEPSKALLLLERQGHPFACAHSVLALFRYDLVIYPLQLQDPIELDCAYPQLQTSGPPSHLNFPALASCSRIDSIGFLLCRYVNLNEVLLVAPRVVRYPPLGSTILRWALLSGIHYHLPSGDRLGQRCRNVAKFLRSAPRGDAVLLWKLVALAPVGMVVACIALPAYRSVHRVGGDLASLGIRLSSIASHAVHPDGDDTTIPNLLRRQRFVFDYPLLLGPLDVRILGEELQVVRRNAAYFLDTLLHLLSGVLRICRELKLPALSAALRNDDPEIEVFKARQSLRHP
mmetsp:Transcript_34387/g.87491  ORF Transcript_34387/g.87491 Transcript_34387/m.87491 type:complete len:313 (+) Transcript_34387:69-1007(+)